MKLKKLRSLDRSGNLITAYEKIINAHRNLEKECSLYELEPWERDQLEADGYEVDYNQYLNKKYKISWK